ncbi:MAG TPA: hypothetical protein VHK69_05530 [Chitinophagaceae bacterium]|nr:hypothetical protein [Chitinophagaceae bacterium]
MKSARILLTLTAMSFCMASCTLFKPKYGCPTDGRNVGAEKLLDGGPKKQPKFKG